jgi:alkylation response protein AidB-like acyl-CoA dehydrogenase
MSYPEVLSLNDSNLASLLELEQSLYARAADVDAMGLDLDVEMAMLRSAGLLSACAPREYGGQGLGCEHDAHSVRTAFATLRMLGRATLSVARLYEGHMNAVKLVVLYGSPAQKAQLLPLVSAGQLWGVWGADGATPLSATLVSDSPAKTQHYVLHGQKAFASGLGLLDQAIVTFNRGAEGVSLALVNVREKQRQDKSAWRVSGMKATWSGVYDFEGVNIDVSALIGRPGDYVKEPYFEGGIWRYCAAHHGAAEQIVRLWRTRLVQKGRAEDPIQLTRLARARARLVAVYSLLRDVSLQIETCNGDHGQNNVSEDDRHSAVEMALLGREMTEEMAVAVMNDARKALGVEAHLPQSDLERICRDLSMYLRQASPDGKLLNAGRLYLAQAEERTRLW